MNQIVRQAQERSVQEHRAYLIEWKRRAIILHPESIREGESASPVSRLALDRGHAFVLSLPAALEKVAASAVDFLAVGRVRAGERAVQKP